MKCMPEKTNLTLPVRTYFVTSVGQRVDRVVAAVRALEVGELDHRHRRGGLAEHVQLLRHALEEGDGRGGAGNLGGRGRGAGAAVGLDGQRTLGRRRRVLVARSRSRRR